MRINEVTEEEVQAFSIIGRAIGSGHDIRELYPQIEILQAMEDRLLSLAAQHGVQSGWRIRVADLVKRLEEGPQQTKLLSKHNTELASYS